MQLPIYWQWSYLLAMVMFALTVAICEIIMYELCNVLDSKSLTLKLKVMDVDNLNENWQANLLCQRAYNWLF